MFLKFRDRYKGFKVSLATVRSGTLLKKLHDAGTKISVSPAQAKKLRGLEKILTISKTKKTPIDDLGGVLNNKTSKKTQNSEGKKTSASRTTEHPLEEDGGEEGGDQEDADLEASLLSKFVDVSDLLPPQPSKGTFNVGDIQRSRYFFS